MSSIFWYTELISSIALAARLGKSNRKPAMKREGKRMDYVNLGRTNLSVSRLWLGGMSFGDPARRGWVVDEPTSRAIIIRAIELGINVIDTCNVYCAGLSEEIIGRTIADLGLRDTLVIASKMGFATGPSANEVGYSRKNIIQACEASLRRLGTDHIDIFQTHIWRDETNIEEMVEAFDRLIQDGKILYAGAADMPAWQLAKAVYHADATQRSRFVSLQYHYNSIWREAERELMPFCSDAGLGLVAYSPLGRGYLCGTNRETTRERMDDRINRWYRRPADDAVVAVIGQIALETGEPPAAVALSWVLSKPAVAAAVIGFTDVDQLEQLAATATAKLTDEQALRIESNYSYRASSGH
jgi:aryl-alcohol dehydrogenase-like predicted oxidoreductase